MHLTPVEQAVVLDILRHHLPDREVWIFGSRVHGGRPKPFSDLDLAVVGDQALSLGQLAALHTAFSESALPFRVDVIDLASAEGRFREEILRGHAVLVRPE